MARKIYPSDVNDNELAYVAPYLSLMSAAAGQPAHDPREVFDGLRWLVRAGDGLLGVCVIRGLSKPQILMPVPHVMNGTQVTKESVQMKRACRITVTSPEPLPVHANGEILYTAVGQLNIEMLPGRLTGLA